MLNILLIDSNQTNHKLLSKALNNDFLLTVTDNEKTAIEHAGQNPTDIILLDIECFGPQYPEICEQLRSIDAFKNIPLLLIIPKTTELEPIQALNSGADYYINKPYDPELLIAKIQISIKFANERRQKNQQIQEAQQMALMAMTDSSELGWIIQFMEQSYRISSYEELAGAVFNLTNNFNLSCLLLIKAYEKEYIFSSNDLLSPLETELILKLSHEKRFFDFSSRTQINYSNVSLLVKNMPVDDPIRYGRIKDLLPNILRSTESKIKLLNAQHVTKLQTNELQQSFVLITDTLNDIKQAIHNNQEKGIGILHQMLLEIDHDIPRMGLEEDQEMFILNKIDSAIEEADNTAAATLNITESFSSVIAKLHHLLEMQESIQEQLNEPSASNDNSQTEDSSDDLSLNIELF